jgi:hypothetical protein
VLQHTWPIPERQPASPRPSIVVPCGAACWVLTARKGSQGPFTGATRLVFDWLLWRAPRGAGVLIPSMDFIAREAAVSLASVKRAVRTLQAWGLLLVHARIQAGSI